MHWFVINFLWRYIFSYLFFYLNSFSSLMTFKCHSNYFKIYLLEKLGVLEKLLTKIIYIHIWLINHNLWISIRLFRGENHEQTSMRGISIILYMKAYAHDILTNQNKRKLGNLGCGNRLISFNLVISMLIKKTILSRIVEIFCTSQGKIIM